MIKKFISHFIKNRLIQSGIMFCFLCDIIKTGSIKQSFIFLFTLLLTYFWLCYLFFSLKPTKPQRKLIRVSEQYRPVKSEKA